MHLPFETYKHHVKVCIYIYIYTKKFTKIGHETSSKAHRLSGKIIIQNLEVISFQYMSHTLLVLVIAPLVENERLVTRRPKSLVTIDFFKG